MEAAVLQELQAYIARRRNGHTAEAQEKVKKAARLYTATVRALNRYGGAEGRHWDTLGQLSDVLDDLRDNYAGDADYYLVRRQFNELVLPALKAVRHMPGQLHLAAQLSVVGDLLIHTDCESLTLDEQRAGLREMLRILRAAPTDEHLGDCCFCVFSGCCRLVVMATRRNPQHDFDRLVNPELAAEMAKEGVLKLALQILTPGGGGVGVVRQLLLMPPTYQDETEHHFVAGAQAMVGALLVSGNVATAATAGSWAAGQPQLIARLLEKMQVESLEVWKEVALTTVRLVGQLACVSPPLLEAMNAAGLKRVLDRLRDRLHSPVDVNEVEGWITALNRPSVDARTFAATSYQRAVYLGMQAGHADVAAGRAPFAIGSQGASMADLMAQLLQLVARPPGTQPDRRPAGQGNAAGTAGGSPGSALSRQELMALPVRELKQRLAAAGLDSSRCVAKEDLVELLLGPQAPAGSAAGAASGAGGEGSSIGAAAVAGSSGGSAGAGASAAASGSQQAEGQAEERVRCCSCCGAKKAAGVKLRRCPCNQAYFCSEACQRQLWPSHKEACKAARRAAAAAAGDK